MISWQLTTAKRVSDLPQRGTAIIYGKRENLPFLPNRTVLMVKTIDKLVEAIIENDDVLLILPMDLAGGIALLRQLETRTTLSVSYQAVKLAFLDW